MNKKHLLAIGLFATMFAACSQEEIVSPTEKVDLSNRPTVGSPIFSFSPSTRMGVDETGQFNSIKWEEGVDGIGACIIDQVADLGADTWGDKYTITDDYISTNYQYLRQNGKFTTSALMVEGNYMFYAPYNGAYLTRNAISINMPTVQNVTKEMPNKPIDELYKSKTPAIVGYLALKAEGQSHSISVDMQHVFAYPQFTLKNSYKADNKPADITVTKVEFTVDGGKFIVKAPIDNGKLVKKLDKDVADNWFDTAIETAATADILKGSLTDANKADKITVNFGEGIEIKADESFAFNVVLPAADYVTNKIKATVYTSNDKKFETIFTAGGMVMNPGKRFPSKEYNTDGTLKPSKGTLATLDLTGKLVDAGTVVSATEIKNKADFIAYLANIATRYRDLKQVTPQFIELNTEAKATAVGGSGVEVYDQGIHFTLAADAKLIIDDEVIDALNNYIYVGESGAGSVTFLAEDVTNGKVSIGDVTQLGEYTIKFTGKETLTGASPNQYIELTQDATAPALSISGEVTLAGTSEFEKINVPKDATLTLDKTLVAANLEITNDGGVIEWNGGNVKSITNTAGTLNINEDYTGTATVENGGDSDGEVGTIHIGANVSIGSVLTNKPYGTINNSGFMYADNVNNGTINVMVKSATTKVNSGTGNITNNVLGAVNVTSGTQIVKYTEKNAVVGKLNYADNAGINYVVLNNGWTITNADNLVAASNTKMPATIEFAGGLFTTSVDLTFVTTELIFSAANTEWFGNASEKPTITGAKITVQNGKKLTLKHITVTGAAGSTAAGDQIDASTNAEYSVTL